MSTGPRSRMVAWTRRSTCVLSVTSVGIGMARPPARWMRVVTSSSAAGFRAARATRAPRRPNSKAIARPIPCEAPVTIATEPSSLNAYPSVLAASTEVCVLAASRQLGDSVAAARTGATALTVDRHEAPILLVRDVMRLRADGLDRGLHHLDRARVQTRDVVRFQRAAFAQGKEARLVKDLFRVGISHAGDKGLVAQQILQLTRLPADPLRELTGRHGEGGGAKLGPSRNGGQSPVGEPVH